MAETDNSEIPAITADNAPTMPVETSAPEEKAPEERPKTRRGRPKGSKDAKPRIKRVPMAAPEEQEAQKKTATPEVAAPKSKPNEEEGQPEEAPEEAPAPPKSHARSKGSARMR